MSKPIVAIVGRPNVGKSALFNRLVRKRIAIVEDISGVTRDRLYADADIGGRICSLVDTGGFDPTEKEGLIPQVVAQAKFAMDEADLIVFVADAATELTSLDFAIADVMRKTNKPIIVAANKVDNPKREQLGLYELRLDPIITVSALHGRNIEALVDAIAERLPDQEPEISEDSQFLKIAIVGRPNVGKSSLTNTILGEERTIVSEIPGTTRDAIDTPLQWKGSPTVLIDTAGMRRKARVRKAMEYHSVLRSLRAIDRADVVFLLVESSGVTEQDSKIGGYAHEAGKPIVLVVNKWDRVENAIETKDPRQRKRHLNLVRSDFQKNIHAYLAFMEYAPIHYISALRGTGIEPLMEEAVRLYELREMRVPSAKLNALIRDAIVDHSPPSFKGKRLRIRYMTQVAVRPPTFVVFVNDPELLHFSYSRYLENRIRKQFDFHGTPIRIHVRACGREEKGNAKQKR